MPRLVPYTFSFEGITYNVAKKELPNKAQHDAPYNINIKHDDKWGKLVYFYVRCNRASGEEGRIYSCILFTDGAIQYITVN